MRVYAALCLAAAVAAAGCQDAVTVPNAVNDSAPSLSVSSLISNDIAIQKPATQYLETDSTWTLRANRKSSGRRAIVSGIIWTSINPAVATVERFSGVVTGVAEGETYVKVQSLMGTDSVEIDVASNHPFSVTASTSSLPPGGTAQLATTSTTATTFTSGNSAIATVSATGLVTAVSVGSTAITARNVGNGTGSATMTVVAPAAAPVPPTLTSVVMSPNTASLLTGATQQFAIAGTWSDASTIAPAVTFSATGGTISASGLYTAGSTPGSYRVIATQQGGTKADTSTVTIAAPIATLLSVIMLPASVNLAPGTTQQFATSGTWSDGSTTTPALTYTATGGIISAGGLYTAGSTAGVYRVIVTQQGGTKADTSAVTIIAPAATLQQVVMTPATVSLLTGATQQFAIAGVWSDASTTAPAVTYSATGGTISASGLYTAGNTAGAFRVIALNTAYGRADTSAITISVPAPTLSAVVMTPATATVFTGATQQLIVAATWSDGSTAVPAVTYSATGGTVSASGLYTAGATPGAYTVIASALGKADTTFITVNAPALTSLAISPKSVSLATGATQQFGASAMWNNGATTLPTIAYSATGGTVSATGLYTAGTVGGSYVVIASANGKADTSVVTVAAPTLTVLRMTPDSFALATGATQQLTIAAAWSNGSTSLPALSYSATGGTVSASGVYTAGSTAGLYRVIVSGGGKADTSTVTILQTVLDQQNFWRGQYGAYASPWSIFVDNTLRLGIDYSDTITTNVGAFPNATSIRWHWPAHVSASTGVWGYMNIYYGNYDGGEPPVHVQSRQVKNITTLRQDFSISYTGTGSFNGLNEFYLTSASGNPSAKVIEIGYFLHGASESKNFRDTGRLVGTYQDNSGRTWEARMQGTFCMLSLSGGGDVLSGSIDVKATLNFLISKGAITGDEWFNGIALGVEPILGSGEMKVAQWTVTYN